jgi:protein-disulfide isomerase
MGGMFYKTTLFPNPLVINTEGQPSIGTGAIEVIVFEDLCCTNCRTFTEEIIPKIASRYVDTGKVRLILIPVSFGNHSKLHANAALTVYKMAPDKYISFILGLTAAKASGKEAILNVADMVGGIDREQLAYSIDHNLYYAEIDQNLVWARSLMGSDFGTPTLFINGIETSTDSFDAVVRRIEKIERQK